MTSRRFEVLGGLLFATLATLLFGWCYAPYGFSGLDEGFVHALSWRILQGQLPYVDFVYVRPPGSPLLHAGLLALLTPERAVLIERYLFFFWIAAAAWLASATLGRAFSAEGWRMPSTLLALTGFVLALRGFPPMPWHTVDGIVLGALALYLCCAVGGVAGVGSACVIAWVAASCKQSFLPLPLVVLGWTWVFESRNARTAAFVTTAAVPGLALLSAWRLGILGPALDQIGGATGLGSAVRAGVLAYVVGPGKLLALVSVVTLVLLAAWRSLGRRLPRWIPAAVVLGLPLGLELIRTGSRQDFQGPHWNYPAAWFAIAIAVTVFNFRDAPRAAATLGALLTLAWCASLSWGYPTPILFATPMLFAVLLGAWRHLHVEPRPLLALALVLGLAVQAVAYRYPYRDAPRPRLTHDLGQAFPRLSGVRSSQVQLDRHHELRSWLARYPDAAVLPGMPLASFLTARRPPLSVDWARNAEVAPRQGAMLEELERRAPVVLVEQDWRPCAEGPGCSALTDHVVRSWLRVDAGVHFAVFRRPGGDPAHGPDLPRGADRP